MISLPDISHLDFFNIHKVQDIRELFYNCSSLITLPDMINLNSSNNNINYNENNSNNSNLLVNSDDSSGGDCEYTNFSSDDNNKDNNKSFNNIENNYFNELLPDLIIMYCEDFYNIK